MTIEKSPAAVTAHKAAARADSPGSKAKATDAAPQDGGFMAILGSLDDAPVVAPTEVPLPDATLPQTAPMDVATLLQQNPQIAAAQAQWAASMANGTGLAAGVATAIPAGVGAATGTATGVATGAGAGAAIPNGVGATSAAAVMTGAGAGLVTSMGVGADTSISAAVGAATGTSTASAVPTATLTARGAGAAPAAADPADGLALAAAAAPAALLPAQPSVATDAPRTTDTAAKRPAAAPTLATAGGAATAVAVPDAAQTMAEPATQALQHAAGHARSGKDLQAAAADTAQSGSVAATTAERTESGKWMAALDQARVPQAARGMEPVFAPLLVKAEKSVSERVASAFKSTEPGYSGTALGVSGPDYSQTGAAAPVMAPEMQVAEQVTYWVSQNVQNAELKLDGLGQSPVEVSISVQGNEAHITFRTDEAQTRSVLEAASAHLKDMLQREGMVLTGVSVGASGSGESSGSERRARQAARQGTIAPLQVATITTQDSSRRANTVSGRSVDLFV